MCAYFYPREATLPDGVVYVYYGARVQQMTIIVNRLDSSRAKNEGYES